MRLAPLFRRSLLVLLVQLVQASLCLRAQSFDLEHGREPVVSLDGPWRFHPGDSPATAGGFLWASPGFDDSAWPTLKSDQSWSDQGYPGLSGFGWYRFRVRPGSGGAPAALLLAPIVSSYEVYADGRRLGGVGPLPPTRIPNTSFSYHLFPLSEAAGTREFLIAIRVWHSPIWAAYVGGGPWAGGHLAGDPKLLAREQRHQQLRRNQLFVDTYTYSMAAMLVGLATFCLFLFRPTEREYLWFAMVPVAQALDAALTTSKEIWAFPSVPIFDLLDGTLEAAIALAAFLFLARILAIRIGRRGRILLGLAALSPFAAVLYWPRLASVPVSAATQLLLISPALFWTLYVLVRQALRGQQDARLLLVPILLAEGYWLTDNLSLLLDQAGLASRPAFMDRALPLPPFGIHIQILLNLVFLLAMLIFLIRRFSLARSHEQRLAGEFEAARQVQQILLPDRLDQCPGFTVECVYQPASQVGGDFFEQITDGQGGMTIVVGDVSGKGLPAALLVSVLVGAIRTEAAHSASPAQILASLNQRLASRAHSGFATCLAAHISAAGRLTLANAGHLPPYHNGREIEIAGSLPLGILPQIEPETRELDLERGDRLTFVSDGVVEAQSRSGELFGFDRTRALAQEPAARIAAAAREFGQSDDITVVTVEFSGA